MKKLIYLLPLFVTGCSPAFGNKDAVVDYVGLTVGMQFKRGKIAQLGVGYNNKTVAFKMGIMYPIRLRKQ